MKMPMKTMSIAAALFGGSAAGWAGPAASPAPSVEAEIAALVNDHRRANGLPAVPFSPSLALVAETHARDLAALPDGGAGGDFGRDRRGLACNAHSWTDRGSWTPVCYTADHHYAARMWSKPREITGGRYPYYGFEIGYWTTGAVDAAGAVEGWKRSAAHNGVILEQGVWRGKNWQAMGVGVHGRFAFVWFGQEPDPAR